MNALILLASLAPAFSAAPGGDVLRNGGFEEGRDGAFEGWEPVWPRFLKEAPRFERLTRETHGGSSCGTIQVVDPDQGGYCSLTQAIEDPPREAATVRLEGWIRAEKGTRANLLLIFFDPEKPESETLHQTAPASDSGEWVKVEIETVVPAGAKKWLLRCGIAGAGSAAFDDVSLTWSGERIDAVEAVLAVARAKYFVVPAAAGGTCSITFSVPFAFGGQSPLALRVESDPPGAVTMLEVRKDRENRPLRVTALTPGKKGPIKLRAETLVLLRDRPAATVAGVAIVPAKKVPREARVHLRAAPGVEAGDPEVREIAGRLPRTDVKVLLEGLLGVLRANLKYEGDGNQGATSCLRTGQAVCSGYANVCAALLVAAGVPARILACTGLEGKLQEHYIVEAWAAGPGWLRIESTAAAFPWPDSRNLVLRVVYPESPRSPFNVPLYFDLQGAARGGHDGDPQDGCWQSAETLGRFLVDRKDLEAIEQASRKAFEDLTAKPQPRSAVRFAPEPKALSGLGERGRKLLEEIETRSNR